MIHIITGGSGSGKSAFAEEDAVRLLRVDGNTEQRLFYIATMEPFGEEALEKISRHQKMRAEKGFETIECYRDLAEAADLIDEHACSESPEKALKPVVLLEDLGNLVANELYSPENMEGKAADSIMAGIEKLCTVCKHLIIVTNEVFSDGIIYQEETEMFQKTLSDVHRHLAATERFGGQEVKVTEVVYGIPITKRQ